MQRLVSQIVLHYRDRGELDMANSEIVEGLKICELFASLGEQELQGLASSLGGACEVEAYKAGDTICTQGEHKTRLYIVVEGQVLLHRTIYLGDRTATMPVALLGKGRAMGWTALLYGPRYVTASAVCPEAQQSHIRGGDDPSVSAGKGAKRRLQGDGTACLYARGQASGSIQCS